MAGMQDQAKDIVVPVVREHVEMAAFQWAQRDTLLHEDLPDMEVVGSIDQRLEANLDGIRIAGAAAWPFIIEAFESYPEKGELFVTAFHAIETEDAKRIEQAVCFARVAEDGARGLCGAFEWLPPARTRDLVRRWIHSTDPIRCEAAIAALIANRTDPGDLLHNLLSHNEASVRAAACLLAARLDRQDLAPALRAALGGPEVAVRNSAALALAQLGCRDGEEILRALVIAQEEKWEHPLRSLITVLPDKEVRQWLSGLNRSPETAVIAVRALGMFGERTLLPWLIQQMKLPSLAKAARQSLLELFPEVRDDWDDLISVEPADHGAAFVQCFGDDMDPMPVAGLVKAWAQERFLLPRDTGEA